MTESTYSYIATNMAGDILKRRLSKMRTRVVQSNAHSKGWPTQVIDDYVMRLLREELAMDMELPSMDDYCEQEQSTLF